MQDAKDPYLSLLENRNTNFKYIWISSTRTNGQENKINHFDGLRIIKPKVIDPKVIQQQLTHNKQRQKYHHNVHTKPFPKLQVGDDILMQMNGKCRPPKVSCVSQNVATTFIQCHYA